MAGRIGLDGISHLPYRGSKNVTYIQNNFYGSSNLGMNNNFNTFGNINNFGCGCNCNNFNYGYNGSCFGFGYIGNAGYCAPPPPPPVHHGHCDDGEMSKGAKIIVGLGVGATLVGTLTKLFSNGKA